MGKTSKRALERRRQRERRRGKKRSIRLRQWARGSEHVAAGTSPAINYGGTKMSEVLLDFAAPLLSDDMGRVAYEDALNIAAVAWNAAVMPPDEREKLLAETVSVALHRAPPLPDGRAFLEHLIDMLIQRKQEHFGHIRRFIMDLEISDRPGGCNVMVLSSPDIPDDWGSREGD